MQVENCEDKTELKLPLKQEKATELSLLAQLYTIFYFSSTPFFPLQVLFPPQDLYIHTQLTAKA